MKLMLKNVRLSYPSLFTASSYQGQEAKFSATFLIEKGSENEKKIREAIKAIAKEEFGDKANKVIASQEANEQRCLLKDGDEKENKDGDPDPNYAGMFSFKGANKTKVKVIDRNKDALEESDGKPYAGCMVNAQVDIWQQNNKYGKFANVKLLAVQFWEDGEAFGGGASADLDDFESGGEGSDDAFSDDDDWD